MPEPNDIKQVKIIEDKPPKRKVWLDWIQTLTPLIAVGVSILSLFLATSKIVNMYDNSNENKQTQVVIEPRDGDIIVKDGIASINRAFGYFFLVKNPRSST